VALVDEQPPQVVRAEIVGVHHRDAVAEHDEADGLLAGVYSAEPWAGIGSFRGFDE
jgi:hypothetical protein